MWRWLDPVECRIAEQCLARGHVLEAARQLLACREPDHKSVRDLLLQIGPQLVAQTQQAYEAGDLLVAGELIACAAQCIELPSAARALQERIARDRDQRQDADDWRNRRLQLADDWADHGRLRSALGLIEPLLHRRHALLFREEVRGRTARYRVAPLAACSVSVNGQEIPDGQTHWLAHQDVLQFGTESCRWTFQQSVADSGTALLTQTRPAAACIVTPFGVQIRHVILLDDELCIGQTRGAAHLIEPHLPASRLRLVWRADGLHADVDDGVLFVNDGQDREAAGPALSLPAELVLYAERTGLAQAALLGAGGMYELRLRLHGWPTAYPT